MLAEGSADFTDCGDDSVNRASALSVCCSGPAVAQRFPFMLVSLLDEARILGRGNLMVYKIVVERPDGEIDTLYWSGSLEEAINLAREIGTTCDADRFRVIELAGCGLEVRVEEAPFPSKRQSCAPGAPRGLRGH